MSDRETRAERREAAETRRRWVTLAEVVAIAGVLIGALTLWNSWSERRSGEAERSAEQASQVRERSRLDLTATVQDDGRSLLLKDPRHEIQDISFTFPRALGVGVQRPVTPVLQADWVEDTLLKLTDGGPDDRTGRLPVLVTAHYWDEDAARTASAIYDVIWRTNGRFGRGRAFRLEELRLRQRGGTPKQLDTLWSRDKP